MRIELVAVVSHPNVIQGSRDQDSELIVNRYIVYIRKVILMSYAKDFRVSQ